MTWRDSLRPAKLGKASFRVETSGGQLGRNVQVHEYPQRDKPFTEDLGRKTRRFTLECYVLADRFNQYNYMPERDALIAELEIAGAKTLVHPYLGELKVNVVESDGPRESTREGGMARFTLTVVESGEHVFPGATADTEEAARKRAADSLQEVSVTCSKKFDVVGAADHVRAAATNLLQSWTKTLTTLTARVTTLPDNLTAFIADVSIFTGSVEQLILAPLTMVGKVLGIFAELEAIVSGPPEAMAIVRGLFTFGDDLPVAPAYGAASRLQLQTNQAAFTGFIQQAALLTAVQIVAITEFESADDALQVRDELLDVFDAQTDVALDDTAYYALVDARTAFVNDIEQRAAQLTKLITVTLPESSPALVLAFELYADATRDLEIVARNRVRDPLLLPSGQALEVLANV